MERTEKIIGKKLDIPLGDGGLLFGKLLEKPVAKQYAVGIIPHTVDWQNPYINQMAGELPDSLLIDVRKEPLKVLEEIASCEFIISTAMHGLIAADSLGIPNKWIEVSDKVVGGGYKFCDYYSVFKNYRQEVYRADAKHPVDSLKIKEWIENYNLRLSEVEDIAKSLYNALKNIDLS